MSFFGRLTAVLSAIGTAWILALMFLICADVLGRDLFKAPIPGVPEMVAFSIVGIVFLQLAQTLRTGGLTRSDVLIAKLVKRKPTIGQSLECLFALVGAALFTVIIATTWPLMLKAYEDGEYYGNIGVIQLPIWALKAIILIGAAAMAVQFLIIAWDAARRARAGTAEAVLPEHLE
mgnify:CR=1 FL=1